MTDWLDDALDRLPGAEPPADFAARTVARARGERRGILHRFPRVTAAAAAGLMLLAVGYWLGRGAPELHDTPGLYESPDAAALNLDEIYADRELLESLELLADDELELAFRDVAEGTWLLDETVPGSGEEGASNGAGEEQ